ncbi:MAG TPA: hypothetical protein VGI39_25435 [Polyangiaceae bacterium]|jgi:hypothetical protein
MATFLTTSRMSPALAARIEASVSGRRGRAVVSRTWVVSVVRLGVAVAVLAIAGGIVWARHRAASELAAERAALLGEVRGASSALTPADRDLVARTQGLLGHLTGVYEGDLLEGELRAPKAIDAILARPVLYVRGPISGFADAKATAESSADATKDAFALCLVDPPAGRAEKTLLPTVRASYSGGGALERRTPSVRLLKEAALGLPFLQPSWSARVEAAPEHEDLAKLRRDFDKAPIAAAKQAAHAEHLLAVLDEPGDGSGPTELDGERAHFIRVALVEMNSGRPLLRLRRRVDPSGISTGPRNQYARGLDACGLALDVREAIAPAATVARAAK